MEESGQFHVQAALSQGLKAFSIHWIGGWVGPSEVLGAVAKRKNSIIAPVGN
jgi:hypothetical protein